MPPGWRLLTPNLSPLRQMTVNTLTYQSAPIAHSTTVNRLLKWLSTMTSSTGSSQKTVFKKKTHFLEVMVSIPAWILCPSGWMCVGEITMKEYYATIYNFQELYCSLLLSHVHLFGTIRKCIRVEAKQCSKVYCCGHSNSHERRWSEIKFLVVMHWISLFRRGGEREGW